MPVIVLENKPKCQLVTKKLELELSDEGTTVVDGIMGSVHCSSPECLLTLALSALLVPVTSIIVSGSIVIVGNTVHWIEKQGKCEDSITQTAINGLINSTKAIGGKIIQSVDELLMWFKE